MTAGGGPATDQGERLFAIYGEDLDRLARWIGRMGTAQSLTTLARRFVRGRLRYGPLSNAEPLPASWAPETVRLWDPAKVWHEGDGALFAGPDTHRRNRGSGPCYGEVLRVQGLGVSVRIDGVPQTRLYGTATIRGSVPSVAAWRKSVEGVAVSAIVARPPESSDLGGLAADDDRAGEDARIDRALWIRGEQIFGVLLGALRHDARFTALQGRWFVKSLAIRPTAAQLDGLAQRLLTRSSGPLAIEELLELLPSPAPAGDAGLYGLAMALDERPELFAGVVGSSRSRWTLSHPPAGSYSAKLAAYDPETGEILCEPGEQLETETVERLWVLDLLRAVVAR